MSRRLAREAVFKALFQVDVGGIEPGKALKYAIEGLSLTEEELFFAQELFAGTIRETAELDRIISAHLVRWTLDRIAAVDRCLLRMALFEILHKPDIPPIVAINEALDLSKKYSDFDSTAFINGILDKVHAEH